MHQTAHGQGRAISPAARTDTFWRPQGAVCRACHAKILIVGWVLAAAGSRYDGLLQLGRSSEGALRGARDPPQ